MPEAGNFRTGGNPNFRNGLSFALSLAFCLSGLICLARDEVITIQQVDGVAEKKPVPAKVEDAANARQREEAGRRAAAAADALRATARALFRSKGNARPADDFQAPQKKMATVTIQIPLPANVRNALLSRLKHYSHREIYFLYKSCDLTPDQWRLILAKGLQLAEECADQATLQGGMGRMAVQLRVGNEGRTILMPIDIADRIKAGLHQEARKVLRPEQKTRLERALAERDDYRRQACIAICVSSIERKVGLSADQCTQLTTRLQAEWKDRRDCFPVPQEAEPIPHLPNRVLAGILTDSQLKTWQLLPKSVVSTEELLEQLYDAFDEHAFDLSRIDPRFAETPRSKPASSVENSAPTASGK